MPAGTATQLGTDEYGVEFMVADLKAVVDSFGKRPSWSACPWAAGPASSPLASNTSLPLVVDMAPRLEPSGTRKIQEFMNQKPRGSIHWSECSRGYPNYQPHRKRPRKLDGLAKNVRLGDDGKYSAGTGTARRKMRAAYTISTARGSGQPDTADIVGTRGLVRCADRRSAQSFLQQCPHAEYVNVQNAAHMVAGDRNDIFSDAVIEFLKRTVPPN